MRAVKVRKVPQRTCVGCGEVRPKKELIRVVRTPEGAVELDPTGKRSGRGAYVCPDPQCLVSAVKKKALERSLGVSISQEVLNDLSERLVRRVDAGE